MNKAPAFLAFGLLALLATQDVTQTETKVSKGSFQRWIKEGRIMAPGFAGPPSQSRVSAPSVVRLKNGRLRMYFWASGQGHQYIYAAEASPKKSLRMEACKGRARTRALSNREYQRQRTQLSLGDFTGRWHLAHVLRHLGILGAVR